jgi:hypothetical protein
MLKVISLDLEGTLISNAVSQIPRPGLFEFLESCKMITERVVIFTTVKEDRFRIIARALVLEGVAPEWFQDIEYINWQGKTKNLKFIPNSNIDSSILVDDFHSYIENGQEANWVEIKQFSHPYADNDRELKIVLNKLLDFSQSGKQI